MEFASEMVVRAAMLNLKRTELPITYYPDKRGSPPHLKPWADGKRHLKFLLTYSPLWLFFMPSLAMIALSSAIFTGVLFSPPYMVFSFGTLRFGDHWMILSGGLFTIGFQGLVLGAMALAYRVQQKGLLLSGTLKAVYKFFTPGNVIISGTVFTVSGLFIIMYVFWEWHKLGFGALYKIREMIIATTFLIAGLQLYFSALLMTILENTKNTLHG